MIGTMVLVLMGCGSAVFAGSMAGTVGAGVGTVGVALAFGLSVVAMAYAIGGISGCGYVYAFPGYRSDYRFGYSLCPGDHRRVRRADGYRFQRLR